MNEQAGYFAISERQQVAAGMPSTEVPLGTIGEAACRVFDMEEEYGVEFETLDSLDKPPTPDVQSRMRELTDRRCILTHLGMKLAGTPEAAAQLAEAVIAYTYSQDDI